MVVDRSQCGLLAETALIALYQDDWIEANWVGKTRRVCPDSPLLQLWWRAAVVPLAMWYQSLVIVRVDVQLGRRFHRTPLRGHVTGEQTFPKLQMG